MDKTASFHAFVKRHLSLATRRQLDSVRLSKKAAGSTRFGWDDVVTVCRDKQQGVGLADEPLAAQVEVCKPAPAARSAAAPGGAPAAPRAAPFVPGLSTQGMTVVCDLCTSLGVGGANHPRERCYVDPKSRFHKADVR